MKMVLSLSHGQAAVERGFSINKDICDVNMIQNSIIAHRIICDAVREDASSCIITNEMLRYHRAARMKYDHYLAEERMQAAKSEKQLEAEKLKEEMCAEKKMHPKWEAAAQRLRQEADSLAERAEKERKLTLLTDSNETRKRARQYEQLLEESRTKIKKIELQLKT